MIERTNEDLHRTVTKTGENQINRISRYYLELERVLDRIEQSTTHYEVLGIEVSSNHEKIKSAYRAVVTILHPSYKGLNLVLPDETLSRINRAVARVSEAFSVLTNLGKRVGYDNSLLKRSSVPVAIDVTTLYPKAPDTDEKLEEAEPAEQESDVWEDALEDMEFDESLKVSGAPGERRRSERLRLSIPVKVTAYDRLDGKWQMVAHTLDVSRMGVSFMLERNMYIGSVVHLSLPFPVKLRNHSHTASMYSVYAHVRRVYPGSDGARVVGVEFLGELPPKNYYEKPWGIFRPPKWTGPERRREPRENRQINLGVEYLDDFMRPIRQEVGVTENISQSGARIYLKAAPREFGLVRITSVDRNFESLGIVCDRFVGEDRFERLCIQFLTKKWPL